MSGRRRERPRQHVPEQRHGEGKKCADCRKYSRNTFYCSKDHKVLDQNRDACSSFAPRQAHTGRHRKF